MWNPTRALLWEQARVAGVLVVAVYAVTSLGHLSLFLAQWSGSLGQRDFADVLELTAAYALFLAVVLNVARLDHLGHITIGFDGRLARLPVATGPLVLIPFLVRMGMLLGMVLAFQVNLWVLSGTILSPGFFILPIVGYGLLQAMSWGRESVSGLSYLIVSLVVVLPLVLVRYLPGRPKSAGASVRPGEMEYTGLGEIYGEAFNFLQSPAGAFILLPLSLLYAFMAVSWHRRGECHGLPGPLALLDRLRFGITSQDRKHDSALAAQVWYEWQRAGHIIPLATLVGGVFLQIVAIVVFARGPEFIIDSQSLGVHYGPYIALLLSAIAASLIWQPGLIWSSGTSMSYPSFRPASTSLIAQARLLASARSLFFGLFIAFALSSLGWVLLPYSDWAFVYQAYAMDHVTGIEVVGFFVRPMLLAGFIAWILLWSGTLGSIVLCVTALLELAPELLRSLDLGIAPFAVYPLFIGLAIAVIALGYLSMRAYQYGNITVQGLAAMAIGIVLLTLLLWFNSYRMPPFMLTLSCIGAVLFLSPYVSLSYAILWFRNK